MIISKRFYCQQNRSVCFREKNAGCVDKFKTGELLTPRENVHPSNPQLPESTRTARIQHLVLHLWGKESHVIPRCPVFFAKFLPNFRGWFQPQNFRPILPQFEFDLCPISRCKMHFSFVTAQLSLRKHFPAISWRSQWSCKIIPTKGLSTAHWIASWKWWQFFWKVASLSFCHSWIFLQIFVIHKEVKTIILVIMVTIMVIMVMMVIIM